MYSHAIRTTEIPHDPTPPFGHPSPFLQMEKGLYTNTNLLPSLCVSMGRVAPLVRGGVIGFAQLKKSKIIDFAKTQEKRSHSVRAN